jgi:hypothetical protein
MPSKLLYRIGLTQKGVYSFHMFMYGGPLLMFLQEPSFFLGDSALEFFERRVFNDYDFLLGLLMLVLLDTITGGFKAINSYKMFGESYLRDNQGKKVRQFSGRVFYEKMSKKLFGITVAVVWIWVLKNNKFEGASVLKNSYGIYPWEPIKLILKKLDIFINQKTGKVE